MITKEQGKEEINKLVEKYNKLVESGRAKSYNEEMTKKGFILPLFRALGWSVEDGEEVTAEEKISKGRVDYAFRIEGIPKLFLEAKSLREDLDRKEFAEQAINYAWHKGATWAILTDFEGIKVFNAEWKSVNYLQNQFFSINCNKFLDNFEQLWLLSRESLEQGLIDKEAEKWGKKAKKIPVDKQLLNDLTRFRELLTKNILKNNPSKNLTEEELEEAVQRIIDRLIFIRTLEDKQLEAPILQSLIRENTNKRISKKLNEVFRNIDDIYNSKLFTSHLCEELIIDDDVLEKIIYGLFKTADNTVHYDFSAIDADVLGNIYEQYLGHILKKTAKRASFTEGKAHRKEQGIYYTPTYVVDYIVKNTVGELAKDKKFDLKNIKILDPACGSGSFLMKAFDYLVTLDKKKNGEISQTKLDLTGASASYGRKVEILKENIFGVDLDSKAVEIAQLNLLLKTAEKKHRLPTLQENIKVGNSLIDDASVAGDKAFKWEDEFKEVMKDGGFDVVVGNPPYIRNTDLSETDKKFFNKNYLSAYKQYDILILFFEKGIKLLKNQGYLGFITSNKFMASDYGEKLRQLMLDKCKILSFIDVSHLRIFRDASTYPVIAILQKIEDKQTKQKNIISFQKIDNINELSSNTHITKIKQQTYIEEDNKFLEDKGNIKYDIIRKVDRNSTKIEKLFYCQRGSPKNKIEIINEKTKNSLNCILSRDVNRYSAKISRDIFVMSSLQDKILKIEKILMPRTVLSLKATIDNSNSFVMDRIYYLIPKGTNLNLKFIIAILNSRLIDFYYKFNFGSTHVGGGYLDLRGTQITKLPIKITEQQQEIVQLVDKMLSLNKRLNEIKDKQTDEKARLEKEIQKLDEEIDQEVYKIYGITKEEQKIIEESLK